MTANEQIVLKIIKDSKKRVSSLQIAKELKISEGYAELILKALQRKGKIEFSGRWASLSRREPKALLRGLPPKEELKKTTKKEVSRKKKAKRSKKKAKKPKKKKLKLSLIQLKGMTKALEKTLRKAGYKDIEALAKASVSRLMEDTGLKLKQAANLINGARRVLKIIPDTISTKEKQKAEEKKEKPKKKKKQAKKGKKKRKEKSKVPWLIKALKRFFG